MLVPGDLTCDFQPDTLRAAEAAQRGGPDQGRVSAREPTAPSDFVGSAKAEGPKVVVSEYMTVVIFLLMLLTFIIIIYYSLFKIGECGEEK